MSFTNSPFKKNSYDDADLEMVSTMSERALQASIAERASHDDLLAAIRIAHAQGATESELSEASGLPLDSVRRAIDVEILA